MNNGFQPKRLVVGMSGASGAQIGIELLKMMREFPGWETHLIITEGARRVIEMETEHSVPEVEALATKCHQLNNLGASISSGTFKTAGMVVVPCSMKTVSGITNGFSENLLLRAADVIIKERRKLVMVVRESPLSSLHLKNMLSISNLGAIILPPLLTYYNHPRTIEDMTHHVVCKILDIFDLEPQNFKRWDETDDS